MQGLLGSLALCQVTDDGDEPLDLIVLSSIRHKGDLHISRIGTVIGHFMLEGDRLPGKRRFEVLTYAFVSSSSQYLAHMLASDLFQGTPKPGSIRPVVETKMLAFIYIGDEQGS